jgi:hypothetical protein
MAQNELTLLIQSRHPIVVVECDDEARLLAQLEASCAEARLPLFSWSVTDGIRRDGAPSPIYETEDPAKALAHIEAAGKPAVYAFKDLAPYLTDARLVRRVREVAQTPEFSRSTLVLSGPSIELPAELRPLAARWTLDLPAREELSALVLETFKELNQGHAYRYQLSREELDRFVGQLGGLSAPEARRVVARCVLDDGALDMTDFAIALDAKRDRVEDTGVLEFEDAKNAGVELGGLANLKGWLGRAQAGYSERARELGLTPPRGLLLVGVQGCGKSLACRAIARQWGLPLVRLDAGRLFDKYVGESEKNLRKAFLTAEAVAPVVLWIDEIEKAFASGSGGGGDADAGLSKRLFGAFLTWLQEKSPGVFVAATANDLSAVPPELLRKGRFDEVFFVDLPNDEERRAIFALHLERRKQDPKAFDLGVLAVATEGFSGAEIEQAIVTALYAMIAEQGEALTTARVLAETQATIPLSRSRREEIDALRAFAAERFVPAR